MKKILTIILTTMVAITATACSNTPAVGGESISAPATKEVDVITNTPDVEKNPTSAPATKEADKNASAAHGNPEIYIVPGGSEGEGASSVYQIPEYEPWSIEKTSMHNNENAKDEVTIEFNGKSYTGKYENVSYVSIPNFYVEDEYEADECSFAINSETGELTFFDSKEDTPSSGTITEEEAIGYANEIANDYIDISEYTVITENDEDYSNCTVDYCKKVGDAQLNDSLRVVVYAGGFISMCAIMTSKELQEWYKNTPQQEKEAFVERCSKKEYLDKAFEEILKNITYMEFDEAEYKINYKTIVITPDGKPAIYYIMNIKLWNDNRTEESGELIDFIVVDG